MTDKENRPEFDFILSQTDGRPMYVQIMDQIQQRVAVGDWAPGTKLPSIRELAVVSHVSMITVKRAYRELERDGIIVTQQGKGSWVSVPANRDLMQQAELDRSLKHAIALAKTMGLSAEELRKLFDRYNLN